MKILKVVKFLSWGCKGKDHFKNHLIEHVHKIITQKKMKLFIFRVVPTFFVFSILNQNIDVQKCMHVKNH